MKNLHRTAFVHTDDAQLLPALVAIHALRSRGGGDESFDVRLLRLAGTELDARRDGRTYRAGGEAVWDHRKAWSFHYLRRRPPELMNYEGRALVIDPDVFAVRSVAPLFERDMEGKAILCRYLPDGYLDDGTPCFSTGVMLLDCERLTHWKWRDELDAIFAGESDYWDMLKLGEEEPSCIGELGEIWNSFNKLNEETRLLHTSRLSTQPWSTGLPLAEYRYDPTFPVPRATLWQRLLGRKPQRICIPNPDPAQEQLFFELLGECLAAGRIAESYVKSEIEGGRLRRDAFEVLRNVGYRATRTPGASLQEEFAIDESVAPRGDR
jgi:hypothetical protein